MAKPTVFEFAAFCFDTERGLSFAGRAVHLAAKEMRGLALLLARDGRIVTRDEYVDAVWPRGTVSDESIARSVYLLRRALARHCNGEILATVYGSGYRITVPVHGTRPSSSQCEALRGSQTRARRAALETARHACELIGRGRPQELHAAIGTFRSALEIDPDYAEAWIEIARCHLVQAMHSHVAPRVAADFASVAVEQALRLDPRAAGALAARGWLLGAIDHDIAAGLADIDRALALDPWLWQAHFYRAWLLGGVDAPSEALSAARRALDLTPLHPAPTALVGWLLFCCGRDDEAVLQLGAASRRAGHSAEVLSTLSDVLAATGRVDEAIAFARQANEADGCPARGAAALAFALACAGNTEEACSIMQASETDASFRLPRTDLAAVHLALGNRASAGVALAQAHEQGCPRLVFAGRDPRLAALRGAGLLQPLLRARVAKADAPPPRNRKGVARRARQEVPRAEQEYRRPPDVRPKGPGPPREAVWPRHRVR